MKEKPIVARVLDDIHILPCLLQLRGSFRCPLCSWTWMLK